MRSVWFHTAGRAAPKKGYGVSLDSEIGLPANRGKLIDGQANIHLDHHVTLRAGQMMVMGAPAHPVVMRAIGELNAIKQAQAKKHLNRAVDCRATQARFRLAQHLPQIINREICSTGRQFNETFLNQAARARGALASFLKGGMYLICNHELASFLCFLTILRHRPTFPGWMRQRFVTARGAQAAYWNGKKIGQRGQCRDIKSNRKMLPGSSKG